VRVEARAATQDIRKFLKLTSTRMERRYTLQRIAMTLTRMHATDTRLAATTPDIQLLLVHIRDFFIRSMLSFYRLCDSSSHESQKSTPDYIDNYAVYETCGQ
jgi:hypothetical protein